MTLQMMKDENENKAFDQESSDKVEKLSKKPSSSSLELREVNSKIKIKGPSLPAPDTSSGSASAPGSTVQIFNSEEAFEGHRRYPIQDQRKMEKQEEKVRYTLRTKPKKLVIRGDDNDPINSSSVRSFRCLVCDKDFPSKKSLCGHMRSHPDRNWRGMNPPSTSNNNALASSSSSSSPPPPPPPPEDLVNVQDYQNHDKSDNNGASPSTSVPVDLFPSCSGSSWLKKDKRGRKSIGGAVVAEIAAETLMYMHIFGNSHLRHRPPHREPTPEEEAALSPVKKRKENMMNDQVTGCSSSPAGKKSLDNGKEKLEGSDGNEELEAEKNICDMKVTDSVKERKLNKKKRKLGPEMIINSEEGEPLMRKQQEVKPSQRYVCDTCNESFACYQALGGHKTKHRKNIVKSTKGKEAVEQRREEEEEGNRVGINGALLSTAELSGEEGTALICSEERLAMSLNDNENNCNKEEVGEASQQSGSKIRDFDLNAPYVLEDEANGGDI